MEGAHELVGSVLRVEKCLVGRAELLALGVLAAEGLHDADAAEGILHRRVDAGHALAVLAEYAAAPVIQREGQRRHDDGDDKHDGGERPVDHEQQHEGADDLERADEQVLRPVVRELRYVEQIGGDLRHHDTGVVAVVVAEGEALVLLEQIAAHVGLHARAHDVTPISDEPLAARARGVQRDEEQRDEPEAAQDDRGRLREELAGEEVQQLRKGQIDPGQDAGGHEIGKEERLVGLVVAGEPPQHLGGGDVGVCFLGCVDSSGHRPILALWD